MTIIGLGLAALGYGTLWALLQWRNPGLVLVHPGYTTVFWVAALAMIPVHEALHVAAAMLLGVRWNHIHIGFRRGFIYVQFARPLRVGALRIVLLAPLIVLGVPLVVFSLRSGDHQWLVLFAAHIGSTVADLYTWWRLRGIDGRCLFFHEPGVRGLTIYRPPPGGRPVMVTALSGVAVALAALVFGLGPFLVPGHELLGDGVLAPRGGLDRRAFEYNVGDATTLRYTIRVFEAGRPAGVTRDEIPLDSSSGQIEVRLSEETVSVDRVERRVQIVVDGQPVGVATFNEPGQPVGVSTALLSGHQRIRLRHPVDLLSRFTTMSVGAFDDPGWTASTTRTLGPDMTAVAVRITFLP